MSTSKKILEFRGVVCEGSVVVLYVILSIRFVCVSRLVCRRINASSKLIENWKS